MSDKYLLKFEANELKSLLVARHFMDSTNVEIIDRKKRFSFDDSFIFEGKSFDCGYHAVDIGRSLVYNDILTSLDIQWVKSKSTRSLIFNGKKYKRGYVFNELEADFSSENKNVYQSHFLKNLETVYGSDFITFAIEDIAKSYVQNQIWIRSNLSYEIILTNIYPWFFPFVSADNQGNMNKSRPHFHNRMTQDNSVMYPKEGSFMSITNALRNDFGAVNFVTKDAEYQFATFDDNGKVEVEDNTFHVWPINYIDLASRFNLDFPDYVESSFYLVSVILDKPTSFDDHEILVGDKSYYIDRVSSPESLVGIQNVCSLQFECETLESLEEEVVIENIKSFTNTFFDNVSWDKYNFKKVPLKRYNTEGVEEKLSKIITFVESRNPQVIVMNRSFLMENLSEGIEGLVNKIEEVMTI
jgi:hypothetical protein